MSIRGHYQYHDPRLLEVLARGIVVAREQQLPGPASAQLVADRLARNNFDYRTFIAVQSELQLCRQQLLLLNRQLVETRVTLAALQTRLAGIDRRRAEACRDRT